MATTDSTAVLGFAGFNGLSFLRQLGLMLGLAASVAVGFGVVLWSQEPDYRALFEGMEYVDANEAITILDGHQIPYKLDSRTGNLLVEAERLHSARLKLAAGGISANPAVGLEVLDQEQSLGTSQFMETARYRRGLEGELGRTISNINAVRSARVHLAIPKASVFVRHAKRPRASIFVELFSGRALSGSQVKAIRNMVAFSIPELKLEDVTIVDQLGNLLSNSENGRDLEMASRQLDYKNRLEQDFNERVNSILGPIVGAGNYRSEVTLDVDFTEMEQTDEIYNPDLQSVRSEETLEEQRSGGDDALAGGVPGALTNQPPAAANVTADNPGAGAAGADGAGAGSSSKRQSTRNYELDRTISHTRHQVGKVQRISVAVVVDHKMVPKPVEEATVAEGEEETADEEEGSEEGDAAPAEPEMIAEPWDEEQLQRLTQLVKDTVGFSAARGDSVNVINAEFVKQKPPVAFEAPPIWEQAWFKTLVKQVLGGLFVLILVFGVLRPTLKNLSKAAPPAAPPTLSNIEQPDADSVKNEANAASRAADEEANRAIALDNSDASVALAGGAGVAALGNDSEQMMIPGLQGNFEQQMDSIKGLIEQDPNRVAQVIKKWVAESE
ncbi:MAG: flagellar basal-body MS-ring/collar protein FliF [Pseudomonadales bacterium]